MSAGRAALRAEWVKIRTGRSTGWTLVLTFVLCVGLAVLLGLSMRGGFDRMDAGARANFDPVLVGFYGLLIGEIAFVAFGVLFVGSEYTSGMIRASLTAVPRRGVFYGAKMLTGALTASVFSLVTGFATFFTAQAALGPHGVTLGSAGALRATLLACAHLTLMCLFAMGVAAIARGTALPLGIMIPLLFLDSQGLGNAPGIRTVAQYLPDQVGMVMMRAVPARPDAIDHRAFGPWTGLGVLVLWAAAAVVGGYLVLRRRDA
ncbi:ABC transporter permease [Actinoallomurus sp. CA-142502]|jgi:ABC-2 type transport system permease protein|uniref:ABC transporter permease n=1 Tax=Actinoallomurus sp. CA-142502 TaxID=3239885 RepID=UPI003D8E4564